MYTKMTVEFFMVDMPKDATDTFENTLLKIANLPNDGSRNKEINGISYRLEQFNVSKNYIEGDMIKIRMDNIPPKAPIKAPIEPDFLNDEEGLGEQSAFLYRPDKNILLLQRNRYGVPMSVLCRYVQGFAELERMIEYSIILQKDAFERVKQLPRIQKFKIKIAKLKNLEPLSNQTKEDGLIQLLKMSDYFRSRDIEILFSVGHSKENLDLKSVIKTAIELAKAHSEYIDEIKHISISGEDENEQTQLIDLIKDRMLEDIAIDTKFNRWYPWTDRRRLILEAWSRRSKEIETLY